MNRFFIIYLNFVWTLDFLLCEHISDRSANTIHSLDNIDTLPRLNDGSREPLSEINSPYKTNSFRVVSAKRTIIYGPGLKSDFTVPVRYFFIQAVDDHGLNFTSSPKGEFKVAVGHPSQHAQIWTQVLNFHDGIFAVRFKLYQIVHRLQINVTYEGVHVASSPYFIEGTQYPELCFCPKLLQSWLDTMSCQNEYQQIQKDLSIFSKVDMTSLLEDAKKRYNIPGAYSFCHYAIIDNKVFKKCYGQYVGFSMFMDEILLSLARKVKLPDNEILVNLGDWPLENKAAQESPIPFFSWCGSKNTRDIVMPTYDITESSLEMMGRVMLDILSVPGNSPKRWGEKEEKAFWRGRDSRMERLDLVDLGRSRPDIINASLTNFFFFQDKEEKYGPKASHISFFDFFQFKYQINIDGTVAAYRLPYLLAGDSLVLKQDSDYYEHFYGLLEPMVHYVPFKRDLSDLVEKLEWAKSNDLEAQKIVQNSRKFALENLLPANVFCYYTQLLKEFSKLHLNPPTLRDGMEEVPQPLASTDCKCPERENIHLLDEL